MESFARIADGFINEMAEKGYIEGENVNYDIQIINTGSEKEKQVIESFIENKVDLIFSFPTGSTVAAKQVSRGSDIPIVFAMTFVENSDLVEEIRNPGGNITGVRAAGPDEIIRRLEILHEIAPQAKRIYITYKENYKASTTALEVLLPQAREMGLTLVEEAVADAAELKENLQRRSLLEDPGVDAIMIMPDPISHSPDGWPLIRDFADSHMLPIGGGASVLADRGAVYTYVSDIISMGEMAAASADKILKGMEPGSIPVITPIQNLRINYLKARELGLEVPEGLMNIADEIIK